MADKEQLEILKQGVEAWNLWRINNHDKDIDLSGVNLIGARLNGADFSGANLKNINLMLANLNGAKFNDANLRGADLIGANLSLADLKGAYLIGANLQDVIFKNTIYNEVTKWPSGFDPGGFCPKPPVYNLT